MRVIFDHVALSCELFCLLLVHFCVLWVVIIHFVPPLLPNLLIIVSQKGIEEEWCLLVFVHPKKPLAFVI